VPGSALCRSVMRAAGGSLTGTSANAAGAGGTGDPAIALRVIGADAVGDRRGGIDLFVNAGMLPSSPASTLLDMDASGGVTTLRAGTLLEADLQGFL
jgi:tRNA A37 threonylcarbamoyladenosine synthetase subunit TsaC/SUA5/YrdC